MNASQYVPPRYNVRFSVTLRHTVHALTEPPSLAVHRQNVYRYHCLLAAIRNQLLQIYYYTGNFEGKEKNQLSAAGKQEEKKGSENDVAGHDRIKKRGDES
jgi:hypothetical protein